MRLTLRAISGVNVVAIDIASRPWGRTKKMYAFAYASRLPLPGLGEVLTTMIAATWLATT